MCLFGCEVSTCQSRDGGHIAGTEQPSVTTFIVIVAIVVIIVIEVAEAAACGPRHLLSLSARRCLRLFETPGTIIEKIVVGNEGE